MYALTVCVNDHYIISRDILGLKYYLGLMAGLA